MESGQILHVREMYRKWKLQVQRSYRGQLQDRDHTDGHYITLFAEQLTRTFEVLVSLSLSLLAFTILTLLIDSVYICVSLIVNVLLISYIE